MKDFKKTKHTLNKPVLGNIKHFLFEKIFLVDLKKNIRSKLLIKFLLASLGSEKIWEQHEKFREYFANVLEFGKSCLVFRKMYLVEGMPLQWKGQAYYQSNRPFFSYQVYIYFII